MEKDREVERSERVLRRHLLIVTDTVVENRKKIMKFFLEVIVDKQHTLQYYNYEITF